MTAAEPIATFQRISADKSRVETQSPTLAIHPLRIALLGYRSHPFVGGQGIYLKYLSRALVALGHKVDVFSGPPYPELDENIRLIKVPSLDLYEHPHHPTALRPKHLRSFSDSFEWWSMLTGGFPEPYTFGRRLRKLIKPGDYDIVHDNQSLCFGLVDLQKQGIPVVSTIHHPIHRDRQLAIDSVDKWGEKLLVKRWYHFLHMQEKVVKQLHHVVTVSHASQKDIAHFFQRASDSTPVIPNGIDTETFRPKSATSRIPFRIITTSSSDQPLKGLPVLVDAIAALRSEFPNIHCRIIGKLKPNGSVQQKIQTLHLEDCFSCVSGISTEELVDEYSQASLFVCPSHYEGFGLPLGEAMACELPVISTDGGALPEVIGNAGTVVPAGNSEALSIAIKERFNDCTNNHTLRNEALDNEALGKLARKRIVEHFSWQKVALSLTNYYQQMLNN